MDDDYSDLGETFLSGVNAFTLLFSLSKSIPTEVAEVACIRLDDGHEATARFELLSWVLRDLRKKEGLKSIKFGALLSMMEDYGIPVTEGDLLKKIKKAIKEAKEVVEDQKRRGKWFD